MNHWAKQYIGMPYASGGDGTDGFDCWTFFRHVQNKQFGRDVPYVEPSVYEGGVLAVRNALRGEEGDERFHNHWRELVNPADWKDGCAVLMRQLKEPHHVGIWVENDGGGVVHCIRNWGVIFTPKRKFQINRWRIVGVYEHA